MIQDPTDRFIEAITTRCDLSGARILEVGCGKGRITRDLARYGRVVVATDQDGEAVAHARACIHAENVSFIHCPGEYLDFPPGTFDYVVFPLSLHHISPELMRPTLERSGRFLADDGKIVIIEPDDGGAMNEAKTRFGAGSGDESEGRRHALVALESLPGWEPGDAIRFRTFFLFDDDDDFIASMLPAFTGFPRELQVELRDFLARHRVAEGILLDSARRMNVLTRAAVQTHHS